MTFGQQLLTIFAVILGTMLTRFLPFVLFPADKTPPSVITYLGTVLPYAVMGLLIIYCLKDAFGGPYHALPGDPKRLSPAQMAQKHAAQHRRQHSFLYVPGAGMFSLICFGHSKRTLSVCLDRRTDRVLCR